MFTDPISDATRLLRTDAGALEPVAALRTGGRQGAAAGGEALPAKVSRDEIAAAVEAVGKVLGAVRRELSFRVDEDLGRVVVSVRDAETGDLVRQIPAEHMVALARTLGDRDVPSAEGPPRNARVRGLILDERA